MNTRCSFTKVAAIVSIVAVGWIVSPYHESLRSASGFAVTTPASCGSGNLAMGDFDPGDLNQDGQVTVLDCEPFAQLLLNNCQFQCEADIDEDGDVDLLDYCAFVELLDVG